MRLLLTTPPGTTQTGTLASGSATVTGLTDTSLIQPGCFVTGTGIPLFTIVETVVGATSVTLNNNATVSGSQSLTFALEPLGLADAKAFLRVDIPDDDLLISTLITAARRTCENQLRQAFLTQTWTLYLDSFPSAGGYYNRAIREIWPSLGGLPSGLGFYPGLIPNSTGVIDIPRPPLQSITAVQYYDFSGTLQTVDPSQYNVSLGTPARIQPQYSHVWPISRPTIDSVQIPFVAGYGSSPMKVPLTVLQGMKMLITHWYENRDTISQGVNVLPVPDTLDLLLASEDHGSYA